MTWQHAKRKSLVFNGVNRNRRLDVWVVAAGVLFLGPMLGYLSATYGIIGAAGVLVACLVPVLITRGVGLLLALLPAAAVVYVPLFRLGEYNVTVLFLLVVASYMAVLLRMAVRPSGVLRRQLVLVLLSFAPLLPGVVGSIITVGSLANVINGILIYTVRFGLYAIIPSAFVLSPRKWRERAKWVLFMSLLGAMMYLILARQQLSVGYFGERNTGLFYNPNVGGYVAVMTANWALSGLVNDKGRARFFELLLLFASLLALLKTGSRSALIGAAASLLIWVFLVLLCRGGGIAAKIRNRVRVILIITVAVTVAILPHTVMWPRIQELLLHGVQTENVAGRLEAWQTGLKILFRHPFGIGVGNIPVVSPRYADNLQVLSGVSTTDNQFLDLLIETGPLGLLLFLVTLVAIFRRSLEFRTPVGLAVAVNIVAMSVAGLGAFTFYSPFVSSVIWIMYGLAIGNEHSGLVPRPS